MYQYLLLDAARMGEYMDDVQAFNKAYECLYRLKEDDMLASVAPFLFSINEPLKEYYFDKGWGDSWGLIVGANYPFEEVYKHFRKFLMVKTEDGEELYFRFYDPRVLRIFLPTCDAGQLKELFGAVDYFLVEDDDKANALKFSLQNGRLQTDSLTFEQVLANTIQTTTNYVSVANMDVIEKKPRMSMLDEPTTPDIVHNVKANTPNIPTKPKWNIFD